MILPSTDNINLSPNTKKCRDNIVCSYGYKLISVDDQYSKPYKTYLGDDPIDKYLNDMIKQKEY